MDDEKRIHFLKRSILPAVVFVVVFGVHFIWLGLFPEGREIAAQWALPTDMPSPSWWQRYVETESYYLGFSYAVSLAFAMWALRRYREERLCGARTLAIGGITFSGVLAVAGCYLLGCCGSPMLIVYANLFGATFLPWAKPLLALATLVSVGLAYGWVMRRSRRRACCDPSTGSAN